MKILLFNSPPLAGKDTAAKYLYRKYDHPESTQDVYFDRFSAPLKETFAALAKKPINEFLEVDYYEAHKEEPVPWLNNVSFRRYQINLSELHFKKEYGESIFGELFSNRIKQLIDYRDGNLDFTVVVPDSGFDIEISVLAKHFDPKNILLSRIHRKGCDFKKDSRSYVYTDQFSCIDIYNNGSIEEYYKKIDYIYDSFVLGNRTLLDGAIL